MNDFEEFSCPCCSRKLSPLRIKNCLSKKIRVST